MASRKRIPPEPPRPVVPGGVTRPSLRVSLRDRPAIARRRALNTRLLSGACAFDPPPARLLSAADLQLLRRVATERFSSEQTLLRMQAVRELGRVDQLAGVDRLVALATSPAESEQVRAAAAAALRTASPDIARAVLSAFATESSPLLRQTATPGEDKGARSRTRPARKRRAPAVDPTR